MKTRPRTYNCYNFSVIGDFGSKENHLNENQNRHESNDQIDNPIRIKIHQEFRYRKTIRFNSWSFRLNIDDQNDNRQQSQHKPKGSEVFFNDI